MRVIFKLFHYLLHLEILRVELLKLKNNSLFFTFQSQQDFLLYLFTLQLPFIKGTDRIFRVLILFKIAIAIWKKLQSQLKFLTLFTLLNNFILEILHSLVLFDAIGTHSNRTLAVSLHADVLEWHLMPDTAGLVELDQHYRLYYKIVKRL